MVNQYSFLWRREDRNIWVVNASLTCKDEAHAQNDWENKSFTVLKNRVNIDKTEFIVYRSTRVKVNYSKIQCNYCSKVLKVYESLQDLQCKKLWQVLPPFKWFWFVSVCQWLRLHHAYVCVRNAKTNLVLNHYTRNTTW